MSEKTRDGYTAAYHRVGTWDEEKNEVVWKGAQPQSLTPLGNLSYLINLIVDCNELIAKGTITAEYAMNMLSISITRIREENKAELTQGDHLTDGASLSDAGHSSFNPETKKWTHSQGEA